MNGIGVWGVIALLLSLGAAVVMYFIFLNPKNANNYTGATKKIYDFFSFRTMSIEVILKLSYLFLATFITLISFSYISVDFMGFLLLLILGNVLLRVMFEGALLILMIHRGLQDINNKISVKKETKEK